MRPLAVRPCLRWNAINACLVREPSRPSTSTAKPLSFRTIWISRICSGLRSKAAEALDAPPRLCSWAPDEPTRKTATTLRLWSTMMISSRALFERIKRARQLIAVATSSSADELDRYLALTNAGDLVDAVACGDDVQHGKPDSVLIEVALLRAADVAPPAAVTIGAPPYDAGAAKRAGVRGIGMLSGGFSGQDLEASGCIAVYRDPADLLAHYDKTVPLQA